MFVYVLLHIIVGVLNLINLLSPFVILNHSLFNQIGNGINSHILLKGLGNRQVIYIIFCSLLY